MAKDKERRVNSGKTASSVNPQGLSEDIADQSPRSELEHRAKKKNTKI
ncbi:small, acid-soluble spore protein L [Camelliibacillus cellulosilyticus]|uniref:Small, acid-soluble spore protein L n=1 Tax=Camelliibacillus cellulosilyticus TaxID=2174486 RepID=A0ABV9GNY1_9BACL